MKLHQLTQYLEHIAPLKFQESYVNSGLLVGDPDMELAGAVVSLDCTEEVIMEALNMGCNVVISHHPIIYSGIKKFDPHYYVHKAVIAAIKNDIAIYAIHTNLDKVINNGVNQRICQQLGLSHLRPLKPHPEYEQDEYPLSSGLIGDLTRPMIFDAFLSHVKEKMNCQVVKYTRPIESSVQHIAVCGGVGSFLLPAAKRHKADVFITADFKYHEFFDANGEICIMDIGHYESEYYTIELIFGLIKEKFPNFAAHCTKQVTNPIRYY